MKYLSIIILLFLVGCSVKISYYNPKDGSMLTYERRGFNQNITGFELTKGTDGTMKVKFKGQQSDGSDTAEVMNNLIQRIPVK